MVALSYALMRCIIEIEITEHREMWHCSIGYKMSLVLNTVTTFSLCISAQGEHADAITHLVHGGIAELEFTLFPMFS